MARLQVRSPSRPRKRRALPERQRAPVPADPHPSFLRADTLPLKQGEGGTGAADVAVGLTASEGLTIHYSLFATRYSLKRYPHPLHPPLRSPHPRTEARS